MMEALWLLVLCCAFAYVVTRTETLEARIEIMQMDLERMQSEMDLSHREVDYGN